MHVKELAESSAKYDFECKTEILQYGIHFRDKSNILISVTSSRKEGQVKQMRSFADRCSNSRREGLGRRVY